MWCVDINNDNKFERHILTEWKGVLQLFDNYDTGVYCATVYQVSASEGFGLHKLYNDWKKHTTVFTHEDYERFERATQHS